MAAGVAGAAAGAAAAGEAAAAAAAGGAGAARAAAAGATVLLPSSASPAAGMTLRGRPRRSASMLYACAAAASVAWYPNDFPLHLADHFPRLVALLTPLN